MITWPVIYLCDIIIIFSKQRPYDRIILLLSQLYEDNQVHSNNLCHTKRQHDLVSLRAIAQTAFRRYERRVSERLFDDSGDDLDHLIQQYHQRCRDLF